MPALGRAASTQLGFSSKPPYTMWPTSWGVGPVIQDGPPVRMPMYATVDLQVLAQGPDAHGRTLVPGGRLATLAELESAPAEALPKLLREALQRHGGVASTALRRGLHLRVEAALARRGMATGLPPLAEFERLLAERRGGHMTAMLDATLERWEKAKIAGGVERGLAQGIERGLAQGVERGLAEGVERGLAQGVERGLVEGVERGLAEGESRGRVALLGRLAEQRFGAGVAGQLTALLADVSDPARLDEAGVWLLECDTGEALLDRLRSAGKHATGDS